MKTYKVTYTLESTVHTAKIVADSELAAAMIVASISMLLAADGLEVKEDEDFTGKYDELAEHLVDVTVEEVE